MTKSAFTQVKTISAAEYRETIKKHGRLPIITGEYRPLTKKRTHGPKEHDLQKQIVELFRFHGFKVFLMDAMTGVGYFGNDDDRRFAFIADLKNRGYEKGQPDICVVRNKVWFIELKRGKGGRTSIAQKDMADWLMNHGHNYALIDSLERARDLATNPCN